MLLCTVCCYHWRSKSHLVFSCLQGPMCTPLSPPFLRRRTYSTDPLEGIELLQGWAREWEWRGEPLPQIPLSSFPLILLLFILHQLNSLLIVCLSGDTSPMPGHTPNTNKQSPYCMPLWGYFPDARPYTGTPTRGNSGFAHYTQGTPTRGNSGFAHYTQGAPTRGNSGFAHYTQGTPTRGNSGSAHYTQGSPTRGNSGFAHYTQGTPTRILFHPFF